MSMKIIVQLVPDVDGGYTVFAPEFPGCISEGDTEEEAIANIREVIPAFLELRNERLKNKKISFPFTREIEIKT